MAHVPSAEMLRRLEESDRHYNQLTEQLSLPHIVADQNKFRALSKEHADLTELIEKYRVYRRALDDYEGARKMIATEKDKELVAMAAAEMSELEPALESQAQELQVMLLPKDPNDSKNVILELRAGVGGDESALFVADLWKMYQRYADSQRFRVGILSLSDGTAGGFKELIALIEGEGAYSKFKYEAGVHRVQRVPKTEAQGRVHTSTVTVAVLPEAEEVDIELDPNELRIDVFRAGGHGGQSVNTTDSAVRIVHLPTGETVVCMDEKSQLKNKNKAMKILRSRVLEKARAAQQKEITDARRSQVGGGFRNERIRTYNFPQSRCTDHRIGLTTHGLAEVLDGKITNFVQALHNHYQTLALTGEAPAPVATDNDD